MEYAINSCENFIELPVQPPEEVDKIWTFKKTSTTLSIDCNGVEVLNYEFSNSSWTACVSTWGGDVVGKISFDSHSDTASDSYRAYGKKQEPTGSNKQPIRTRH